MQFLFLVNRISNRSAFACLLAIAWTVALTASVAAQQKLPVNDPYQPGRSAADLRKTEEKLSTAGSVQAPAAPSLTAPANDNFANAVPLGAGGIVLGTNVGATAETGEPVHGAGHGAQNSSQNNSVWYKYTAGSNTVFSVLTGASNPSPIGDTVISVYTGSSVNSLTPVIENDDYTNTFYSKVTFSLTANETYYIAIDGYNGAVGDFGISYVTVNMTSNDNMASAEDLGDNPKSPYIGISGSNRGSTGESGEPVHVLNLSAPTNSVWYRWTAPAEGAYSFTTAGSNFDTVVGVYRTQSPGNTTIASVAGGNDDFGLSSVRTSKVTFYAASNEVFLIAVDGFGANTGTFLLNWYKDLEEAGRRFDMDGDSYSDISIFRPSNGQWWLKYSNNSTFATTFGTGSDKPVPADFTGDGKVDIAFWRPSTGFWYVLRSEDYSFFAAPYGTSGDIPVPAKYDNDNRADFAVFRPSTGTWYIQGSRNGFTNTKAFGISGDIPVPADYDADGFSDIAIFRPSNGQWWVNRSTEGLTATTFGAAGDIPVPGPYTSPGRSTIAFWRPTTGEWFILNNLNGGGYFAYPFGTTGDIPAPADYGGDGKFDVTVFRPSTGLWYINHSTGGGGTIVVPFGSPGDRPLESSFLPQ